jgi:hypothetical protein
LLVALIGCAPRVTVELDPSPQTVPGIGAGQGVSVIDGRVLFYGDRYADDYRGVIREALWDPEERTLTPTGRDVRLQVAGQDLAPHPTGLTRHGVFGTVLGDTVNRRGTLFWIDLDQAMADGSLDRAVIHRIDDTAAVNGTRPCFVRLGDRWLVATSDYGDVGNRVRLYDPDRLRAVSQTSEAGVELASFSCGPFVQNLLWLDGPGLLVLVQNTVEGLGWRLTFVDLERSVRRGSAVVVSRVDLAPADELEGMAMLDETTAVLVSASRRDNVRLARVIIRR